MKPGTTRFTLTDVSGNSIIFVDRGETDKDQETLEKADDKDHSPLQKSIAMAIRFRDYKEDEHAAAKTLDVALRRAENGDKAAVADSLILRIDLASSMDDLMCAEECKVLLSQLGLSESDLNLLAQKHDIKL